MEEQNAQETQPDASQNPPPPPPIVTDEPVTSPDEQPGNSHNTGQGQAVDQEPVKIIIQEDNRSNAEAVNGNTIAEEANNITRSANRIANNSNLISFFSLILAAAVFYFTYLLFIETQKANQTTKNALDQQSAKDVVDRFIEYRKTINEKDANAENKRIHDSDIKRQNELIELQRASTQAQIDAFRQEGERFNIQNQPYLQIENFTIDTFVIGKSITTKTKMVNLGVYPVILLEAHYMSVSRFSEPEFKVVYDKKNSYPSAINAFVSKEIPYEWYFSEPKLLTPSRYINLLNGNYYYYFFGYFKYQNLVTKDIKYFKFVIKRDFLKSANLLELIPPKND